MTRSELSDYRLALQYPSHPLLSHLRFQGEGLSAESRRALMDRLEHMLAQRDDAGVRALLDWPAPPAVKRAIGQCLQDVIDASADLEVRLELFAIPVIMLVGTQAPARVPMTVHDVDSLHALFRDAGCLGPSTQFSLGRSLCDEDTLMALSPSDLYHRARLQHGDARPLDLPPAAVGMERSGQSVHLRFLLGSELLARGAPGIRETAGAIGRWGSAFTRELAAQLACPGVTLLPLPRVPRGVCAALTEGRFCREELAFQFELGEQLRAFRSRTGDPSVRLFVAPEEGVVAELASPWESATVRCRWRLRPEDEFGAVQESILGFLRDCRITQVQFASQLGSGPTRSTPRS